MRFLARMFKRRERPLGRHELFKVVRGEAERAFEGELRHAAVFLTDPGGNDVGLEELRDFFENLLRDLRDVEFVDQRPRDLVERGLALESEPLGKFELAGASRLKFRLAFLHALHVQVRFRTGQRQQQQGRTAHREIDLHPGIAVVVEPSDQHVGKRDHQRHAVESRTW